MQAVILTGGLGTRLRPVTARTPKGLVPVAGRPFLEYLVEGLKTIGVKDILLCTGWLGDEISRHFGSGKKFGIRVRCSREERPLGTGGALKAALSLLAEEFYLLNGDTFLPGDWGLPRRRAREEDLDLVLSAVPSAPGGPPPNLRLGEGGVVTAYSKAKADETFGHVDAGFSYARRRLFRYFPVRDAFSLEKEVYPALAARGRMAAVVTAKKFYDIGTPEGLQSFSDYAEKTLFKGIR